MRATGIVRKIDNLGRIVLPIELRKSFGWEEGTPIEVFTEGGRVVLGHYEPHCTFCESTRDMVRYKGKLVCQECIDSLK